MVKYLSGGKDLVVRFINGLGDILDALAGLAPGGNGSNWAKVFGLIVTAVGAFGFYHFKDPGATVQALTSFIVAVSAVAVAAEQVIAAFKQK